MALLDQPTTSRGRGRGSRGRGRGRGRERGRGRGRDEQVVTLEDTLFRIRAERQTMQRRVAALPADARRELVARKREAHLERTLLPDAPPCKQLTRRTSPERQPCVMADLLFEPCVELRIVEPTEVEVSTTSGVPHSSGPNHAGPAEVEASTSGGARCFDLLPTEPAQASTSQETATYSVYAEIEYIDEADAKDVDGTSSTIAVDQSEIGVQDPNFESILGEWLRPTDMLGRYDDAFLIPTVDAASVPACDSDLTPFQAEVLRREDDANDQAVREIMPDDCCTFVWNKDKSTFLGRRETFTGTTPGPTFDVTDQTRAIDVFDKTFDVDFIDYLCRETNRNAEQKIALLREENTLALHSRFHRWTPTDRDEMISFLAILILQGLYPLPEEEAYFKYNGFGTMPYFPKIMSYNRFLLLKNFLHFVDTQTCQDTTRLCEIRPVIVYFNDKFSSLYMPSQEIAIDESLLKWHGRLTFAQKISSKAAKVGVKTYELCESSSGYLWKFFVYAGKDKPTTTTDRPVGDEAIDRFADDETNNMPNDDGPIVSTEESVDRPTNATAKIVYDLIEPLLHRGHTVIMDNFYNSPLLLRSLKKQKTDCYGTLRLNREFVPDSIKTLTKTDLRHGEVVATYCSDLSIMVWRDANIVSMISSYHDLQIGIQDKYNRLTYKPKIVLDYNKTMGGVDRKDQILSAQPIERSRNKVWYKKLFRRLYNAAIFNGFVIFSGVHRKISHRQFRTVLAEDLLRRHRQIDIATEYRLFNYRCPKTGQVTTSFQRKVRPKTQARPMIDANHFPVRTGSKHSRCSMCPKRTRTLYKCEECEVNLCIDRCFKAYHKP